MVAWQIDFTDCDLVIDTITIATQSVTTESGRVEWTLEGDDETVKNLAFRDGMQIVCFMFARLWPWFGDLMWKNDQ